MAPTLARARFDRDGRVVYEEKIDGWRMLAYRHGSRVPLVSRRGVDHIVCFHELTAELFFPPVSTGGDDEATAEHGSRDSSRALRDKHTDSLH